MLNRVEVAIHPDLEDPIGKSLCAQIKDDLSIPCKSVRVVDVYTILARLTPDELAKVANELFTDSVIQISSINQHIYFSPDYQFVVEVGFRPGVTDNVGKSAREGIQDTLSRNLESGEFVFKSSMYWFSGLSKDDCFRIAKELLANELIQHWIVLSVEELNLRDNLSLLPIPLVTEKTETAVETISLNLSDKELIELSQKRLLALDLKEMKAIKEYYENPITKKHRKDLNLPEEPTDIELEILAQTWSEHCKHKIFNAKIKYDDGSGNSSIIDSLFKTYIKSTT